MKKQSTPRFDVSIFSRLQQAEESRKKLLGYEQYRVYDIVKLEIPKGTPTYTGIKRGNISFVSSKKVWYLVDDLENWVWQTNQNFKVQWLKPKHVTFLKLKGHRVEKIA